MAIKEATADVREGGNRARRSRCATRTTPGAKKLGHGEGYIYPHDDPAGFEVDYLPDELKGKKYYRP